jgi:hypothetical protein
MLEQHLPGFMAAAVRGRKVGVHHMLCPGRERHLGMFRFVVHAVGNNALVVEGREHVLDGEQDVFSWPDLP